MAKTSGNDSHPFDHPGLDGDCGNPDRSYWRSQLLVVAANLHISGNRLDISDQTTFNMDEYWKIPPLVLKIRKMARVTRLELATSGVTGRRSNQLSYRSALPVRTAGR